MVKWRSVDWKDIDLRVEEKVSDFLMAILIMVLILLFNLYRKENG